jgi:hypothetical protein
MTRLGGTLLARRPDPAVPGGEVFELLVPNAVYPSTPRSPGTWLGLAGGLSDFIRS